MRGSCPRRSARREGFGGDDRGKSRSFEERLELGRHRRASKDFAGSCIRRLRPLGDALCRRHQRPQRKKRSAFRFLRALDLRPSFLQRKAAGVQSRDRRRVAAMRSLFCRRDWRAESRSGWTARSFQRTPGTSCVSGRTFKASSELCAPQRFRWWRPTTARGKAPLSASPPFTWGQRRLQRRPPERSSFSQRRVALFLPLELRGA